MQALTWWLTIISQANVAKWVCGYGRKHGCCNMLATIILASTYICDFAMFFLYIQPENIVVSKKVNITQANRLDRLYATLLHQRYVRYALAVSLVSDAQDLVDTISGDFVLLLLKDDCDSLDKCKSLRVTALARMFTFAKRSIPALDYLAKVREFMANVEDDDAATALINKYADVLPLETDTFPKPLSIDETADFVDPETLLWLEELDRQYELCLKIDDGLGSVCDDDQEEDCVKVQQT